MGKGDWNSHLGSNPDPCYIQNRVITNHVIKRFRCILYIFHQELSEKFIHLPPYCILTDSGTPFCLNHALNCPCTSWAWSGVAVTPVPIAHTGSYAITIFFQSSEVTWSESIMRPNKIIPVIPVSLPTLIFAPNLNILFHSQEKKKSSLKKFLCFISFPPKKKLKVWSKD